MNFAFAHSHLLVTTVVYRLCLMTNPATEYQPTGKSKPKGIFYLSSIVLSIYFLVNFFMLIPRACEQVRIQKVEGLPSPIM